jgi:hypothetical protein
MLGSIWHKQNNFESDEMNNFEVKVMRENMCVKLKIKKWDCKSNIEYKFFKQIQFIGTSSLLKDFESIWGIINF